MTRADPIAQIIEQPQPINNFLSPRQAIAVNKAFLKVSPHEDRVEPFRVALLELLNKVNPAQSEEFHKNLVIKFFEQTFKQEEEKGTPYFINTKNYEKGEGDLVIHTDKTADSSVGVILEFKKPKDHNAEMPKTDQLNVKALQQLLFYFLQERLTHKNLEVKKLVITNIYEWFIFDAQDFEQFFVKSLEKSFNDFIGGKLSGKDTEFFYKNIAKPAISSVENNLKFVHFDLRNYQSSLESVTDEAALVDLFKILSPEYLLKLPSANDSNRLDEDFYNELLHIIGLTVVKVKSKKLIERKAEKDRNRGSLLENVISRLQSLNKLSRLSDPLKYGETEDEQLFAIALALVIVWVNRILFLKLLEAQLLSYHRQNKASFKFLNIEKIKNYDDLEQLFFEVLAVPMAQRTRLIQEEFSKIPYLNSSLFEPTDLEQKMIVISNLRDELLPLFSKTILNKTGEINALEYLFAFLNAYDFGSEDVGVIKKDQKRLISSSVLGLIFERINGYKDGSFFTPAFITMYMCRETIRRAVIQKFNEVKGWNCESLTDLYNEIRDKKEANQIINSLKICDPAVGSGHFLVSALNEIIAIKSELGVLMDREGKSLRDYAIEVANDELSITYGEGDLTVFFEYNPRSQESQRVQETLFHEKQKIIESCLFGVDINENSVQICRLRLWIELLKNAYYKTDNQLETLPNIDINIKTGNSLISRFPIDSDLKSVLFASKNQSDILNYKNAVRHYFEARSKQDKKKAQDDIKAIKDKMNKSLKQISPKQVTLGRLESELSKLEGLQRPFSLGIQLEELDAKAKKLEKEREKKIAKLSNEIDKLKVEIEELESGRLYENALEWRFEFPEVLNDQGDFVGFDVVIGNPPYGVEFSDMEKVLYKKEYVISSQGKIDSFKLFYERAYQILKKNYYQSFIAPNTFLYNIQSQSLREFLLQNTHLLIGVELRKNIFEDAPDVVTVINISKYTKPYKDSKTLVKVAYPDHSYSSIDNNKWEIDQIIPHSTFTDNTDKKINLRRNFKLDEVIKKVNNIGNVVADFFELKQGTKPYGNKERKNIELIANHKIDKNWESAINGRNISQYHINFENGYVKRCPELHTCLSENIINREKIYFQRMRKISLFPRIVACYDDSSIHGLYTCSVIFSRMDSNEINLKYLLSILNSHLINIWYKNFDTDIEIKLASVKQIPIPKISKEKQANLILLVDKILTAKKSDPKADTTALEKEIDRLVYKLYDLLYDEVKIIDPEFELTEQEYTVIKIE